MTGIDRKTKYTNKNEWLRTFFAAIISLIVGIWGGQQITNNIDMDGYLKEANKEKIELEKKIEDLENKNEDLINVNKDLEKKLSDSNAVAFPEGYYYPASGVYLLDKFEINNGENYRSFADASTHMKGQVYNNGLILSRNGQVVFYLKKEYKMLEFNLGPIDNNTTDDAIVLKVYADGQQMNKVINQSYEAECTKYTFDLANCNELKIQWSAPWNESYGIADLKIYK